MKALAAFLTISAVWLSGARIVAPGPHVDPVATSPRQKSVSTFVGTTPATPAVLQWFGAPGDVNAQLIEWSLDLVKPGDRPGLEQYELRYTYGLTQPNHPGIARNITRGERRGSVAAGQRVGAPAWAEIIKLDDGPEFARLGPNVLHLLESDRTLKVGNGGWSYSLNRDGVGEKFDPTLVSNAPEMSYTLTPLATGPSVYGVFEGRTPCQNIARQLKVRVDAACQKVKWRVTLYHDPQSRAATTYKVEGGLNRDGAWEGKWSVTEVSSTKPPATVFRLAAGGRAPAISLLKGDDNVLFFLDGSDQLLVGNTHLNYSLDRRRR